MSCCFSITVIEPPASMPSSMLEADGSLLLDVGDESPRVTSKSGVVEDGKSKESAVMGIALPMTRKNKAFASSAGLTSPEYNPETLFSVFAVAGMYVLPHDSMRVVAVNENSIEIELTHGIGSWWQQASNLKISDIDFGQYVHDKTTIEAQWSSPAWQNNSPAYYHALVHYGGFRDGTDEVFVEDLRPLIPALAVLQKGFCHIGWSFVSPMLESDDFGRRLYCYLLKKDFGNYTNAGKKYRVEGSFNSTTTIYPNIAGLSPAHVSPDNITYNPQNQWVNYSGVLRYTNNIRPVSIKVEVSGDVNVVSNSTIHLGIKDVNGQLLADLKFFAQTGINTIQAESSCFFCPVGTNFYIENLQDSNAFDIQSGFTVRIKVCTIDGEPTTLYEGDDIIINELLREDITLLDFVKGMLHIGFRAHADYSKKIVYFYPYTAIDVELNSNVYESFFLPASESIRPLLGMPCEAKQKINIRKERYLCYAFKKSEDVYIKREELESDKPLFSKTIDYGIGEEKTKYERNPLFEPTAQIGFGENIKIPAMWDNKDGKKSSAINPRILFCHGLVKQRNYGKLGVWHYEGAKVNELPYASQLNNANEDQSGEEVFMDGNVAYEDVTGLHSYDMYRLMLYFKLNWSLFELSVKLRITPTEFMRIGSRQLLLLEIFNSEKIFAVQEIRRWDACTYEAELLLKQPNQELPC